MAPGRRAPLEPQQLHHSCDPEQFRFQNTAELEDLTEVIGQMRAMDAVRFGTGIRHESYNLFVLGPAGIGKRKLVRQFLEKKAGSEHEPDDWCYLNNFAEPHKPQALRLPSGRGAELRRRMEQLVDYLLGARTRQLCLCAADGNGDYPEGSVNRRVAARLARLTEMRDSFALRPGRKPRTKKRPHY